MYKVHKYARMYYKLAANQTNKAASVKDRVNLSFSYINARYYFKNEGQEKYNKICSTREMKRE